MTDQLDTAVLKAGFDALREDPLLNVQDGKVANGTVPPYVVGWGWVGYPEDADSNALDGRSRTLLARWYLQCVGKTREAASEVAQRCRGQLLDRQLVLPAQYAGVALGLVKQEQALQPSPPNETTGQSVFVAVCVYKVRVTT